LEIGESWRAAEAGKDETRPEQCARAVFDHSALALRRKAG
jgi:hypothetical protein